MRSVMFACYFMAIGWYVRASGLDEDLLHIGQDAYKQAVTHTVKLTRDLTRELDRQELGEIAS